MRNRPMAIVEDRQGDIQGMTMWYPSKELRIGAG